MTSSGAHGLLLDCDYILALSIESESTHARALSIHERYFGLPHYILQTTLYELATVASRRFNHTFTCDLLADYHDKTRFQHVGVTDIEPDIWKTFYTQTKKSTSFFDCANLVAARTYNLKIASFDGFYPKSLLA